MEILDDLNKCPGLLGPTSYPTISTLSGTKDSSVVLWRLKGSYLFKRAVSGKYFEGILKRNQPKRLDSMNIKIHAFLFDD